MGDYNSLVGDRQEFIEGVDELCEREIIDTNENAYSDIFVDFLVNSNCVMLNGRNNIENYYTYLSTTRSSVVHYEVVRHSLLPYCQNIVIIRTKSLFTAAGCIGVVDQQRANMPDHSFLRWTIQQNTQAAEPNVDPHIHSTAEENESVRYDFKDIPTTFVTGEVSWRHTQNTINNTHSAFQELVQGEMTDKISHKIIYHQSHTLQKKQHQHKPW